MSGFFAIRWDGSPDPDVLARITAALSHRGEPRTWGERGVTLAGIDSRFGPGLVIAEDLAVAASARIDNRDELDALLGTGAAGDAERILLAWRRWGAGALDRLIGDFAGAVWDRRRRTLTVLRDAVGARGAILARAPGRLLAGSTIAAMLADPNVDRSIDDEWVATYLAAAADFATATGFRAIRRLEPGTIARDDDGAWRTSRWFRWRARRVHARDPDEYALAFRELFDEAVRCRLEGARRPGVLLSGGLDSTSVMMAARATDPDADLVAISMAFEDERGDERALQELVAKRAGAHQHWVSTAEPDPFGDIGEIFARHGVPPIPPNHFHIDLMGRAAASENVDVVLDGIDGDSVVGGNFYFLSDLLARGRWRTWAREARAAAHLHGVSRRRLLRHYSLTPLVPPGVRYAIRKARGRSRVPSWMDPAFARRMRLAWKLDRDEWRPGRAFRAMNRTAVGGGITPLVLELLEDEWAGRGIEIGHPFLDRRLVEFCLGLPREQKIAGGYTKIVLRAAMRGTLPSEVAERADKADLSGPLFAGLSGHGGTVLGEGLREAASNPGPWFLREQLESVIGTPITRRKLFDAYRIAWIARWRAWLEEDATPTSHRSWTTSVRSTR